MGSKTCFICGQEYKLNMRDRLYRKQVELLSSQFAPLKDAVDSFKDPETKKQKPVCNDCWKKELLPIAKNLAGIAIE